jgi:DNA-binding Lrp family transcriptional regulator
MKAYVLISIRTGDVKAVVSHLRKIPAVVEANMTFGPFDAVAVIETEDINTVGAILASEIQPIAGILETQTCLAVNV